MIKAYLGLAMALHKEASIAIGLFVLSHIFKGMHNLVELEDEIAMVPLWMV